MIKYCAWSSSLIGFCIDIIPSVSFKALNLTILTVATKYYGINCDHAKITGGSFSRKKQNEPRYEKTGLMHMRKQRRRSAFVFTTRIVQSLCSEISSL